MSAATPRLRADLSIIPQVYGGESSFVVKDLAAQKYYRFGDMEVRVMRCFDGRRTAAEIAMALAEEGARISEQAVDAFARRIAGAGFFERTTAERTTLELERLRAERQQGRRTRLFRGELMRMRWSFGDPDALLTKAIPYLRWMFTPRFIVASVALFVWYLVLLAQRWDEFKAAMSATYSLHNITLGSVVTMWITAAVVILIHELGHGFACKYFGGEVRELGFMLLYFQPAFYCNVSDAWGFQQRSARLWVTVAGPWIQFVVASVAAVVWAATVPGTLVWEVALAAMFIGGVTTIFANMNPLLPLDGYFALTDWLEIPNLRQRSFAHFEWWMRSRVLRLDVPEPPASARERSVFLTYGSLATGYISALLIFLSVISLGWAGRTFGGAGIVLGAITLVVLARRTLLTVGRWMAMLVRARRAMFSGLRRPLMLGAFLLAVLLLVVPWPLTSSGTLVVHPITSRTVSALGSGVVAQVFVAEGMRVNAGAPLVRILDRSLEQERLGALRAVDSLTAGEARARSAGRAGDAAQLAAEGASALATLAALDRRANDLTLRAATSGVVATRRPEELVGRRVEAGDSLLAIAAIDSVELRIALAEAGATRVRAGQTVRVVSYADVSSPWTGRVAEVSSAGMAREAGHATGAVEARVRRVAGSAWRAGAMGEASVEVDRSNLLGALWWKARQLLRSDLLL